MLIINFEVAAKSDHVSSSFMLHNSCVVLGFSDTRQQPDNSMGLFVGSWVLLILHWLVCIQYQ